MGQMEDMNHVINTLQLPCSTLSHTRNQMSVFILNITRTVRKTTFTTQTPA